MKRILGLSLLASSLASTSAMGADPVIYDPVPAPQVASPFSWAGPYIGLHAGYGWGRQHDNQSEAFPGDGGGGDTGGGDTGGGDTGGGDTGGGDTGGGDTGGGDTGGGDTDGGDADRFSIDGFVGGVHAGYNWQNDSFVYGIEGDLDYTNLKGGSDFDYAGGPAGHLSFKSDWQASLRARAGYAVDTWLFYVTGGVAFGHAKLSATDGEGPAISDKNTHVGWTVGAGIEKAFTPNLIGRLEARYTDFGKKTYNLGEFGEAVRSDWHQGTVMVGLSYKF